MTQAETILFWFSFVGACAFLINGLYATLTLRQYKSNPISSSETLMTYMTAIMLVLFIVFAVELVLVNPEPKDIIIVPCEEQYNEYGTVITETNDTIVLYTKEK